MERLVDMELYNLGMRVEGWGVDALSVERTGVSLIDGMLCQKTGCMGQDER
jgi:hypothetical protein